MYRSLMTTALVLATASTATAQSAPAATDGGTAASTESLEQRLARLEQELVLLRLQLPEDQGQAGPPQSSASVSPNVFNPTVTAVGNGLYRYDDRPVTLEDGRIDNNFNLREIELDFRAAIDPFADGLIILAFPSELPGEFGVEVEEAFATIKSLPLPLFEAPFWGLKLKGGRFRTEVGRINRLHLHDLPQIDRPLVTQELFGEDGFIANGLSAQVFLPTLFDEESAVELTAQLLTGGGVPVADGAAQSPGAVANLRWFRTFAQAHNFDLAFLYHFGRTDPDGELSSNTFGVDALYKWKPLRGGDSRSLVLGGQLLYSRRDFLEIFDEDGDGEPEVERKATAFPLGYFAFLQYQLTGTTYLGARWDDTATLDNDELRRRAVSGYLTWYPSEFLRFRFGYQHLFGELPQENGRDSAFAELNFIFGAHPPEPFWVNK